MKKGKLIFVSLIIFLIVGLVAGLVIITKKYKEVKSEKDKYYNNMLNASYQIKQQKAKNKEIYYEINQLTLERDELKLVNEDLEKDIKNMKSKLKNVESVTRIETKYIVRVDTIKFIDTVYSEKVAQYKDDYIKISTNVGYDYLTDFDIELKDSTTIISETVYKGWWIFRRPIFSKIKIKSENPYYNLDRVETINFRNKR